MRPRVLLVASEAIPLIKTGGLADVITAMASALAARHVDVTLLLPGYPAAMESAAPLSEIASFDDLPGGPARLMQGRIASQDIPVLLLDCAGFRRRTGNPYVEDNGTEYPDNAQCFAALAHAAVRICAGLAQIVPPHVVHAHDWHAALIPGLLHAAGVHDVGTVLTVHNLAFQGLYPLALAGSLGVPDCMLGPDGGESWGQLNFLKAGIRFADRISIVSHSYAREIRTPRFGCGLDAALTARQDAIVAIPNGVDVSLWNPSLDGLIAARYCAHDMHNKSVCKRDLLQRFGLSETLSGPVLALGSRITHQKMADVALLALPRILDAHEGLQVAVLGRGEHRYEQAFVDLAARYPGRVGVHIGYDEEHAHALHAGADMLLHGTRFEPFGLTPIYAMRYGTLPVASRVGGLIDTIVDAGTAPLPQAGATGFLFDGEESDDMVAAVERALAVFAQEASWRAMQRNAMGGDFSWAGPVEAYLELYRSLGAPCHDALPVDAADQADPAHASAAVA